MNQMRRWKGFYVLTIAAFLFGIYVLFKGQTTPVSALMEDDEKEEHERLGKLDPPADAVTGTVVDITGQLVAVQGTSPRTISLVYVNGNLPAGLAPGMTVSASGQFGNGLISADTVTITGGTPWPGPTTPPQPFGQIDHIIFVIQENHSFDNYFGTYPKADGLTIMYRRPRSMISAMVPGCLHWSFLRM